MIEITQRGNPLARLSVKPWRLFGFGYYQAWIYLAVLSTVLFADPDFFSTHLQFTRQFFSLSVAVCLFCLIFVSQKLDILSKRHYLLVMAASLTAMGTMLISLPLQDSGVQFAVAVVGMAMTGIGNSFLIVTWGALWSRMDTDRMGLHLVVSNAFAGCLYLVVTVLPDFLAVIVTAALPLCSAFTLLASEDEPLRQQEDTSAKPKRLLWKAIVAMAVIPFVFGIARAFSSPAEASDFDELQHSIVLGMTVFALAVAVFVVLAPRQRTVVRLYRFVVPLMAAGFIALPFAPNEYRWMAFSAIMCGFYSFEGLVWLLQPEYVFRTKTSTIKVFGWGRCLFHLFGFAGATFGFFAINQGMASASIPISICLVIVLVLILLSTYVFTEHDLRLFIAKPKMASEPDDAQVYRAIGAKYGLSGREEEVLAMLGKGRSAPFIADSLFISKGTVKTHTRHIYDKMGVHSKQELLDIIENEGRELR